MAPSIRDVTSFGIIEPIPDASSTGGFHLPTNLRQVKKQIHRTEPESLPEEDANKHEVRYFLYQLLTVESYRIAKSYPQWVLETCAFWQGTGADLRYMTDKEMKLICPLDSGHCTLEKNQKTTPYPLPGCRAMIGETIGQVVKKLKAKEVEKMRLEREWRETQLGNSVSRRAIDGHFKNRFSINMEDLYPLPRPVRSCSSAMSLPVSAERITVPDFKERQKNSSEHLATDHHNYTFSSGASLYPYVAASNGPISLPPNSGEGSYSSGNTKSTAQTSPPRSIEETSGRLDRASQLTLSRGDSLARRLSSAMSSRSLHNSLSTMRARQMSNVPSMGGIVEQKHHSTNIAGGEDYFGQDYPPSYDQGRHISTPYPHYQTQEPPVSLTQENLQEVISRNRYRIHKPPRIIYHVNPVEQKTRYSLYSHDRGVISDYSELSNVDSISCVGRNSSYPQSTYSNPPATSDSFPRPHKTGPPPGIPQPHYSSVQEMSNYMDKMFVMPSHPTSSMSQHSSAGSLRRTLHPNSMNYPRPDICGPRISSPALSIQALCSLAPSLIQRSPLTRTPSLKRSIPLFPTFTGPNRSTATSAVDTFALERGAYTTFKSGALVARSEVVNSEADRMSGMVPSKLHREEIERVGPTVRLMDGIGRPYPTLVEQIWEREILDGRRQIGRQG